MRPPLQFFVAGLPKAQPRTNAINMKSILLSKGQSAIVDDEDFESLSKRKWCALTSGKSFYAVRHHGEKFVYMHREIMATPKGMDTDHINGDKLDNRRSNLRAVLHAQNTRGYHNRKVKSSKFRGVQWQKNASKWMARVKFNTKGIYLGLFTSEIDAARAYDRKASELGFSKEALNFQT